MHCGVSPQTKGDGVGASGECTGPEACAVCILWVRGESLLGNNNSGKCLRKKKKKKKKKKQKKKKKKKKTKKKKKKKKSRNG
jgi:hypothetical protein